MAYVYALINKDTLAYICREKGVTGDFIANKTKISATNLALWLAPSDSALPTIKQAKKLASCLHIPFAGLYMNSADIPLKKIPNVRNMRTMLGTSSSDDSALNIAIIDVLLERDFLSSRDFDGISCLRISSLTCFCLFEGECTESTNAYGLAVFACLFDVFEYAFVSSFHSSHCDFAAFSSSLHHVFNHLFLCHFFLSFVCLICLKSLSGVDFSLCVYYKPWSEFCQHFFLFIYQHFLSFCVCDLLINEHFYGILYIDYRKELLLCFYLRPGFLYRRIFS